MTIRSGMRSWSKWVIFSRRINLPAALDHGYRHAVSFDHRRSHALISGQRIIFTAFAYVFQELSFSLRVSGAFRLPGAVGWHLAVLVQPLDDEIRPQVPVIHPRFRFAGIV